MINFPKTFIVFLFLVLTACSSNKPSSTTSSVEVAKPVEEGITVKPAEPTVTSEQSVKPPSKPISRPISRPPSNNLSGTYRLFAGSEISYGVTEQKGQLYVSLLRISPNERMQKIGPYRYKFKSGEELRFVKSPEGIYDRFITLNEGRQQQFIREDGLQRSRTRVRNQAVYTNQLIRDLKPGGYAYSRFISPSRGLVDYSVYLPREWQRNSNKTYPLIFFLHGQTGWERSFPDSVPATQLNQWIAQGLIPPMVIVSLRTGRLSGNEEEQWTTPRNERLLTSENSNDLRAFVRQQFRAGMSPKTTAIHGHSRGSRAAIHYALKYPTSFSSAVANAFVSDYALQETQQLALLNSERYSKNRIPLRISIGDRDEFVVNMGRKATPVIHDFLNILQIPHDYEVFPGVNHGFVNIWNTKTQAGITNGLAELQLHASAWGKK